MTFLMSTLQIYVEIDVSAIWLSMKIDYKDIALNSSLLGHFNCLSIYNHSSRYTRLGFSVAILAAILEIINLFLLFFFIIEL